MTETQYGEIVFDEDYAIGVLWKPNPNTEPNSYRIKTFTGKTGIVMGREQAIRKIKELSK